MQSKSSKYADNPLGLPMLLLDLCETIGRTLLSAAHEHARRQQESQIVDTDYEIIEPKQLPSSTE